MPATGFRYQANAHQKKNAAICSRVTFTSFFRRNCRGSLPSASGWGSVVAKMPKTITRPRRSRLRFSTFVRRLSDEAISLMSGLDVSRARRESKQLLGDVWCHISNAIRISTLLYTSLIVSLMRARSLVLGLVATALGVAQESEAQAVLTRVYRGNDFAHYCLDPPYWSYHAEGFWHSKSAHWLYRNHQRIYIDIKLRYAVVH